MVHDVIMNGQCTLNNINPIVILSNFDVICYYKYKFMYILITL